MRMAQELKLPSLFQVGLASPNSFSRVEGCSISFFVENARVLFHIFIDVKQHETTNVFCILY